MFEKIVNALVGLNLGLWQQIAITPEFTKKIPFI